MSRVHASTPWRHSAAMTHWPEAEITLGQCHRRWPDTDPAFGQWLVFSGQWTPSRHSSSPATRYVYPMPDHCWLSVCDAGPALSQHWVNVSCTLGYSYPLLKNSIWNDQALHSAVWAEPGDSRQESLKLSCSRRTAVQGIMFSPTYLVLVLACLVVAIQAQGKNFIYYYHTSQNISKFI